MEKENKKEWAFKQPIMATIKRKNQLIDNFFRNLEVKINSNKPGEKMTREEMTQLLKQGQFQDELEALRKELI